MKKRRNSAFALLLALGLCLTLCACEAKDPEHLLKTQPPTKAVQEEPTDLSTNLPTESPAQPLSTYAYGNMQRNVPSGNFMQYENIVLFVSSADDNLYSYNIRGLQPG